MTRPIASYAEQHRAAVVQRRILEQRGGLGYQAARDAQRHIIKAAQQRQAQKAA